MIDPVEQEIAKEESKVEVNSLDSILVEPAPPRRGRPPKEKPVEAEAPKVEPPKAEVPKTETPKVEPPKQEFTEKERAFMVAAQDERRKRQALEAKVAELEAQKTKEPPKPFWDDPDGAINQRFAEYDQRLSAKEAQIQTISTNIRLDTAEAIAKSKYPDFSEKIAIFPEILQQNPGLQNEWISSPDPAEYAYQLCKNRIELQQAGSLDTLRANIEKEIRIKLEAELREKDTKLAQERAALPGSLSNIKGGTQNRVEWAGPTGLDDILGS